MGLANRREVLNPYTKKKLRNAAVQNYRGTSYSDVLNLSTSGAGWFLAAYGFAGDDDNARDSMRVVVDNVELVLDYHLWDCSDEQGSSSPWCTPIRFESKLQVQHKSSGATAGVSTSVIYILDSES